MMKLTSTANIRKFILISAFFFLTSGSANAENLATIYSLAQQNDPKFKVAKAALESAYESVKITRGNFMPDLGISASYTENTNVNQFGKRISPQNARVGNNT